MVIVVSFSGGRSSGMMLHRLLDQDICVVFCNTGKEHPVTLDFVRDCQENWNVPITWLEYAGKKAYRVVDYETASRNGEPFARLIEDKHYLPNMVARFCTSELKVLTIERYLKGRGIDDYEMAVGIRGDEPRRLAKMRAKDGYICPIADATEDDVHNFWQSQPFDLKLPDAKHNFYSNCDLCFLKGGGIKASLIKENPGVADWWIEQEEKIGARFRSDQPSYADLKIIAKDQQDLFADESVPCFCGD